MMSDTETPGLFLTLEGIDGAGKSTHLERLVAAFRNAGRTVVLTREPGGTELAERLRDLVLRESMDALTEALVVFAARRDHLERVIRPALARGDVVVSDRFSDASFAYQGGGRQLDWEVLQTLERWVQTAPGSSTVLQPDLCLWLDLPPELAARRRSAVRPPDRFESQDLAFFERVAGAYARRLAQSPERFCRVDATEPVEAVWRAIAHALQGRGYLP